MVKIRINDGNSFEVWDKSLEEVRKRWILALYYNEPIGLDNKKGTMRYLNPQQILYIEGDT